MQLPPPSSDLVAGGESADELLPHRLRERPEEGRPLRDRSRPRERQLASTSLFGSVPGKKEEAFHYMPETGANQLSLFFLDGIIPRQQSFVKRKLVLPMLGFCLEELEVLPLL